MNIGKVIKKYRKEMGLTQEEMANRLGVTAPAVNKWENGNSNPDIELLAPIARLLHISPDTLLSFREKLTDAEIEETIRKMDEMFAREGYDRTYEWALSLIKEYPNCNMLIWQVAVILDARRVAGQCEEPGKYDEQIRLWYEMALRDEDENIRRHAADSLIGFYLRKKDYKAAEKYLDYFSDYDLMKKIHQGRIYEAQGKIEDAYEVLEGVLFSEYNTLNLVFSLLVGLAFDENDIVSARFLAEKMGALASIFDRGKYQEYASMLDIVCAEKDREGTFEVVQQCLKNIHTMWDFSKSGLYRHMKFKNVESESSFMQNIKEELREGFKDGEEFAYMKGYEPWEKLLAE